MKTVTLPLVLLLIVASLGLAQDADEVEADHNVNSTFVTPHTDWATPYALGKTRVLFFVNGRGTAAREVIELKQRFDFEPQMVFWGRLVDTTRDEWHGGEHGLRRMTRLLAQRWDAFVFMGVSPELMPVDQQYAMIEAVTEGAGLVLVSTDDKRLLKEKNRLAQAPAFLGDVPDALAFTVLKGRGVRITRTPTIEYRPGWEVAYDEWDMGVGKAILWAAGKEPQVRLKLSMPTTTVDRRQAAQNPLTMAAEGLPAGAGVSMQVRLRRDDGWTQDFPLPAGMLAAGAKVNLSSLPAGSYFWDVIARTGKTVAAFGALPFTVTSTQSVGGVKLERDWGEIGDTLSGVVTLAGDAPTPGQTVVVSLLDRRGRELVRQTIPAKPETPFAVKLEPWMPMLVTVRAALVEAAAPGWQHEVASAWQFAHVVKRHRGQFNFVMWDTPRGNLAPAAEESLARNSVTLQLGSGTPPPCLAAQDIAWIPYTTDIANRRDEQGVMKPCCWNDEAAIQARVDEVVQKHLPARQHGVFVYSLGDEIAVRGSCLSSQCLAAYQRYLQDQYRDIAALNASWGSQYANFDEVRLSTPTDNEEAEALQSGNFPRWFDRQAYQSYNFCKLCERFGKGFRTIDPQSRCGFEGAGTFTSADDLDGFVRYNTFWSPYPGTADEVLRSIAPRDFPRANWMGYTKDADSLLEKYWRMVTRGCDAVWWWRWEVIGRFHGWLAPSLDPYPAVQEILRDTQIVRDGLGDLLLQSDMQTDGIGILYSQPSAYAAKVQSSPSYGGYEANHAACHAALRELGLNFRYFTDRQMRLGEVDLSKFKAIILPLTQAMGAQEAQLFRQYVQNGGTLIADVRPAIYDGHVKPLTAGQLDDVFGIKRTGAPEAALADGQIGDLSVEKVRADPGVEAAGAQPAGAAGKAPLWLNNSFGKGRTLLLNLALATYPKLGVETTPERAASLLRTALEQATVKPALDLCDAQGRRLRNVEVTRWVNGPVQIVSIFRHGGAADQATIRLPQPRVVYDLKGRRSLGKQSSLTVTLTPSRAQFFALAAEPLKPVTLKAAPAAVRGSVQRVRLATVLPQGRQAVKVTVKLPNGQSADWVARVALVDAQGTTVDVPVAYNDPAGTWSVSATDLYTGQTSTAQFSVK